MNRAENRAGAVSVVLVNYNDRPHLEGCLNSVAENKGATETEIIVVDNASSDGSPELLRQRFPWVRLIPNVLNVGFARANNQALRQSRGEFILFLNTDTILPPGTLDRLRAQIEGDASIGGVGPALWRGKKVYQVSFGRKVEFFSEIVQKALLNSFYRIKLRISRRRQEVGWLSAACLLVRRKALEEAGFFDENFFLYFEDIDLCRRMRQKGWRLVYFPETEVIHSGGGSTSRLKFQSRLEYRRSQLYFYRKHNSRVSVFLLRLYFFGAGLVLSLGSLFRKGDKEKFRAEYVAWLRCGGR